MSINRKRAFIMLIFVTFIAVLFFFSDWVGRMLYPVKFEEHILASSEKHEIEPSLVAAIIRVESNFRTDRVSPKEAVGLMQIMPSTAEWIMEMGSYRDYSLDDLTDPEVNIELGTWYIQSLQNQFEIHMQDKSEADQIALLAASYNAGPGNLNRWLDEHIWDGSIASTEQIPFGETRHYIQRVHYYYGKYKDFYDEKWEEVLN